MTLLFLSLAGIIAIIVILVSAKFIKAGFDARGEVKEEQREEKLKQEDEDILDELKRKNLSEEDLKDLYEKIQNNKKNKGTITFVYHDIDQLNKIIDIIKSNY